MMWCHPYCLLTRKYDFCWHDSSTYFEHFTIFLLFSLPVRIVIYSKCEPRWWTFEAVSIGLLLLLSTVVCEDERTSVMDFRIVVYKHRSVLYGAKANHDPLMDSNLPMVPKTTHHAREPAKKLQHEGRNHNMSPGASRRTDFRFCTVTDTKTFTSAFWF
jgi:hypothetical protein